MLPGRQVNLEVYKVSNAMLLIALHIIALFIFILVQMLLDITS